MLKNLSLKQLYAIDDALDAFKFKQGIGGEPFHPIYKQDKKSFDKLVRNMVTLKGTLRKFFQGQNDRINQLVQMHLVQADEASDLVNDDNWASEDQQLAAQISPDITVLFTIGLGAAEAEFKADSGLSATDSPQAAFLRNYVVNLAGGINDVTKKNITEQIRTSIALGESRAELVNRLGDTIDSTSRARSIAQTESVRAFSQGRLAVGKALGYQSKEWQATASACPICQDLDGEIVDINDNYSDGTDSPPAHPNCKCGELIHPEKV
jgi:SPP1 gp7 family putative phage head morphogenesis protein